MRGRKPAGANLANVKPLTRDELPDCPRWLLPDAKEEWDRIVPLLTKQLVVTAVDMANLAVYCQTFARWRQAEQELTDNGSLTFETNNGDRKLHPAARHAALLLAELRRVAGEFGFSPATRNHVPPREESGDELANF